MTQPETEIRTAWRRIAGPSHDGCADGLLIRYAEPHRRYHTATHIMFVLRHLHEIAQSTKRNPSAAVVAAALYHDAIYDPTVDTNEALSAVLAAKDLAEVGWPAQRCESVAAMIIATGGHLADPAELRDHVVGPAADRVDGDGDDVADTVMLLDADLAILGAEPGAYQAYVNGVRSEYAYIDDEQWRAGRAFVLQHFLGRRRLFVTEYMYAAAEHRARANIEAELAALSHRSPTGD